jgi:hypothetical protein
MEKYLVISNVSGRDEIEYVIEKQTENGITTYRLRNHSDNKKLLCAYDTGEEVLFTKKFKKLNYTEIYEVRILLDFMNKSETVKSKHRFVKDEAL